MVTAAIFYQTAAFNTSDRRLMGRQAANEGFLKALSRYSRAETLYCYSRTRPEFEHFRQQVNGWLTVPRSLRWVCADQPSGLREPGLLYRADPMLTSLAWRRRYGNQRDYSLCGITHTLVDKAVMTAIGECLTAPVQPWDALICTSHAVKTMVERLLQDWQEYFAERLGVRPLCPLKLPVIPLGVDCEAFPQGQMAQQWRQQWRQELGIPAEGLVVLFVGRLIFHAKAHPVPMYLTLELAAQTVKSDIYLLQVGWFEDEQQETDFRQAAATFCPSVKPLFIDGRQPQVRQQIWSAADVFLSLADNIQETFGLTPVEAMASGLPVVVSDWNGYKETVRHEIDGFRVPTVTPPPGCGYDLATHYYGDYFNYSTYVGSTSLMTAVDINACTKALVTLFTQPELRQRMGENGRLQARNTFDWPMIIAAYESLWQELADTRQSASAIAPVSSGMPRNPGCDDPFRSLSHYPTQSLQPNHVLTLGQADPDRLQLLRDRWMTNYGENLRLPSGVVDQLLALLAQSGSLTVAELIELTDSSTTTQRAYLLRTLVYMLKFNIVAIA